jgi:hypothetical protein
MKTLQIATFCDVISGINGYGAPAIHFKTSNIGGTSSTSCANHEFSGDKAANLFHRAGTFDIRQLEGRICNVWYDDEKGFVEFNDFPQQAIVHSVTCDSSDSTCPTIRFSTTLSCGVERSCAQHQVTGQSAFSLLARAKSFDVNDLEGRACTVWCNDGTMEFHDFD